MSNSSHGKQQPEQNIAGGFGKQQPISLIGSKKSEWSTYSPHQDDGVKTIGTVVIRGHTLITLAHKGTYLVCKMLTTVLVYD